MSPASSSSSSSFKPMKRRRLFNRPATAQNHQTCFDSEKLGDDLIIEILSKLPAKSVIRFRSVIKKWNNITKTDYFSTKFQYHSSRHNDMIFQTSKSRNVVVDYWSAFSMVRDLYGKTELSPLRLPEFSFVREIYDPRLIGTCNGLVGLYMDFQLNHMSSLHVMLLLNPATNQYRVLPEPNTNPPFSKYDITMARSLIGFDFVHGDNTINSNEYKFAKIFSHNEDAGGHVFRAQVLERGKNSWRTVKNEQRFPRQKICFYQKSLITLNGVLYWIAVREGRISAGSIINYCIVSFDLRDETFSVIEVPAELRSYENEIPSRLYSWRNSLAILTKGNKTLWVLSNNSVWSLQFRFEDLENLDCIGYRKDDQFIFRQITGNVNDNKHVCHELISYDPNTGSKYTIKLGRGLDICDGVLNYVQTLAHV